MKPGKFTHTIAVILSSITSLFAHGTASKAEPAKSKFSKKSQNPAKIVRLMLVQSPSRLDSWLELRPSRDSVSRGKKTL